MRGGDGPGSGVGGDDVGDRRGAGDDGEQGGKGLAQQGHGAAEDGEQARGLGAAAAGHEDEDWRVGCDGVAGAEAGGVALIGAGLQHGVAGEGGGQVVAGEELDLEGEEDEQTVPQAGVFQNAVLAPGPDLRADIVDAFEAERLDAGEEAQGEARAVDGDDEIGAGGLDVGGGFGEATVEVAEAGEDFGQAHDGEVCHGKEGGEAGGGHAGATDAGEVDIGALGVECCHEAGAEDVSAGFAGEEPDGGGVGHGLAGCSRVGVGEARVGRG